MRSMAALSLVLVIGCIELPDEAPPAEAGSPQTPTEMVPAQEGAAPSSPESTAALPAPSPGVPSAAPAGPPASPGGTVRYTATVQFREDNPNAKQLVSDAAKLPEENLALLIYVPSVQLGTFQEPAKVTAAFDFRNGADLSAEELKSRLEAIEGVKNVRISVSTY